MIKSWLINNAVLDEFSKRRFLKLMDIPLEEKINFMVMKTEIETKSEKRIYYCAWAGGRMQDDNPILSPTGMCAFVALLNLPVGNDDRVYMQELKGCGHFLLRHKVFNMLSAKPPLSKVCFFGNMAGELDGYMTQCFGLQKGSITV